MGCCKLLELGTYTNVVWAGWSVIETLLVCKEENVVIENHKDPV